MSWTDPRSVRLRERFSNEANAQPEAPQAPTPPPVDPTPAATPVIPAQEDVVMGEAPVADNEQTQFIFPLIGMIALIWLRQLLATLVAAVAAPVAPPAQLRYHRVKGVKFEPHPELVLQSGSTPDAWTPEFRLQIELANLKGEKIWHRTPESLQRSNVVMSSLNCDSSPPIEVEVFENIIRFNLGRLANTVAGGEPYSHAKAPPRMVKLFNELHHHFEGDENQVVRHAAAVLYRNMSDRVKRFLKHSRAGGDFTLEFIDRLQDQNRKNATGNYSDVVLGIIEGPQVNNSDLVRIIANYNGKTDTSFATRWPPYLRVSGILQNLAKGYHFGPWGRKWKGLARLFQLLICNRDDKAFKRDGVFCKELEEDWNCVFEGTLSLATRCIGWDLPLLQVLDNQVDRGTQCSWVALNYVDPTFDALSYSDLSSVERSIIAKRREEKRGMPFMTAYASGIPKKDWLEHKAECLADGAYPKAVRHIQALCGDGITISAHKNHQEAPELSTIRGKKNLFQFDFALSNNRIFKGKKNGKGWNKAARCSFEAIVPSDAKGSSQDFEVKVEFKNPNTTLYHAHVYTGNSGSAADNIRKTAEAFAEMTRIKASAPNLSILYRPHAKPGMTAAPWVEFVKSIYRSQNKDFEVLIPRLLQCRSVLNVNPDSLVKSAKRIEREAALATNYLINKKSGKFDNREANVKVAAKYASKETLASNSTSNKGGGSSTRKKPDSTTNKGEGSSTGKNQQKKNQGQEGSESTVQKGKKRREDEDSENLTVKEGKKRKEDKEENLEDEDLDGGIAEPVEYGYQEWMEMFGYGGIQEPEDQSMQE